MHVILSTQRRPEPAPGEVEGVRRVVVRAGQMVRVGSTEWADICVASDEQMQDEHFQVECVGDSCRIAALGAATIRINGQEVEGVHEASHGDQIEAGQCEFLVTFPDAKTSTPTQDASEQTAAEPVEPQVSVWPNLRHEQIPEITESLSDAALLLVDEKDQPPPDQLLSVLLQNDLHIDAISWMAQLLPKRSAVWWALQGIESLEGAGDEDRQAIDAVRQWCEEPGEENRQACGACAEAANPDRPEASLAWSAFYSGGSMVPDPAIEAPPDDALTSNCVIVALGIAASSADDPVTSLQGFLDAAPGIAEGNVPWDIDLAETQAKT